MWCIYFLDSDVQYFRHNFSLFFYPYFYKLYQFYSYVLYLMISLLLGLMVSELNFVSLCVYGFKFVGVLYFLYFQILSQTWMIVLKFCCFSVWFRGQGIVDLFCKFACSLSISVCFHPTSPLFTADIFVIAERSSTRKEFLF